MSFRPIKGQEGAIHFLKGITATGKIAHAYIFLGPAGVGKKLTALEFAKAVNCAAPEKGEACDGCPSCKKIDGRNHPDVFLVAPEKEGASIKIDDVRAVTKDISLKPYEGRKKVYIIDEAGRMTQEASNAFLKTLESPPSDAVIILIAENLGMLLETIVSRSSVVRFFPLGADEVSRILTDAYAVPPVKAQVLAHLVSGRIGEALKYKDSDVFERRARFLEAFTKGSFLDLEVDKMEKAELRFFLDVMLGWYRDIIARKVGAGTSALINADYSEVIARESGRLSLVYLERVIGDILKTMSVLEQNANPKIAMGALALSVCG